jgi:dTDP-4-dehydrorhamnose 3,5-epimerase
MKVTETALPGVLILEPKVHADERGFFTESWNQRTFHDATGLTPRFVQDNHSRSTRGVLRGIHYQLVKAQGKLVRCARGAIFDVAVDLRRSSATFGQWVGQELSDTNHRQMWIPEGYGHAFLVLSDVADFLYKTTEFWMGPHDRSLRWNDPDIGIEWPLTTDPILAQRDRTSPFLKDAEVFL